MLTKNHRKFFTDNIIIVLLTMCFIVILSLFFVQTLRHEFIHPDSYLYITRGNSDILAREISINELTQKLDFFTYIKPITSYFTAFSYNLGGRALLVNSLLIIVSFILISLASFTKRDLKKKNFIGLTLFISIFFVFNANNLYWIGRFSGDYFAIFLISLLLYALNKKRRILLILTSILLVLTRTEFLFILPVLYSGVVIKRQEKLYALVLPAFIPTLLGIIYGDFAKTLLYIVIPLALVTLAIEILNKSGDFKNFGFKLFTKIIEFKKYILLILSIIAFSYLTAGFTGLVYPAFLKGLVTSILLSFGLYIFYVSNLKSTSNQIKIFLSVIILSAIYLITADDSFRYFIFLSPLMLFAIFDNLNLENISFKFSASIVICCIQASVCFFLIPTSVLKEDYWKDRLEYFYKETSGTLQNKEMYSSAPIISAFYNYKSHDICEINPAEFQIQDNFVFIFDKYGLSKCEETLRAVFNLILDNTTPETSRSIIYKSERVVELERFSSLGEESILIDLRPGF